MVAPSLQVTGLIHSDHICANQSTSNTQPHKSPSLSSLARPASTRKLKFLDCCSHRVSPFHKYIKEVTLSKESQKLSRVYVSVYGQGSCASGMLLLSWSWLLML